MERQVKLLPELGLFGISEGVHRAWVFRDPVIRLRCVEVLLERVVLLALDERIIGTVQDKDFRLYGPGCGSGGFEARGCMKAATAARSAPARAMFRTTAPPKL